jgi:hypothetical protein
MTDSAPDFATDADFELCNSVFKGILECYGNEVKANLLPVPHRAVLLIWHATGIIGNGGFQYLFEGDFEGDPGFRLTAEVFDEIGCASAAKVIRDAISLFPNGVVITNIENRIEFFQSIPWARREALNKRFWAQDRIGKGEICFRLAAYIRNHPADFAGIPPR